VQGRGGVRKKNGAEEELGGVEGLKNQRNEGEGEGRR